MTAPIVRATPEQWADVQARADDCQGGPACLLELRARVEALEQQPEPAAPAPAGSLVDCVAWKIAKMCSESRVGTDCTPFGRDILRAVADWMDSIGNNGSAADLRREADR